MTTFASILTLLALAFAILDLVLAWYIRTLRRRVKKAKFDLMLSEKRLLLAQVDKALSGGREP